MFKDVLCLCIYVSEYEFHRSARETKTVTVYILSLITYTFYIANIYTQSSARAPICTIYIHNYAVAREKKRREVNDIALREVSVYIYIELKGCGATREKKKIFRASQFREE